MRTLLQSGNEMARLAVDIYCYRARKYIGAFFAALGEAHAILFGGGVGEHAPAIRERILGGMQSLGIKLDDTANHSTIGTEALISAPNARVEAWVIPVDEQRILAEEAVGVLQTQ
jgi:acetate kinase